MNSSFTKVFVLLLMAAAALIAFFFSGREKKETVEEKEEERPVGLVIPVDSAAKYIEEIIFSKTSEGKSIEYRLCREDKKTARLSIETEGEKKREFKVPFEALEKARELIGDTLMRVWSDDEDCTFAAERAEYTVKMRQSEMWDTAHGNHIPQDGEEALESLETILSSYANPEYEVQETEFTEV